MKKILFLALLAQSFLSANECKQIAEGLLNHLGSYKTVEKTEEIQENNINIACNATFKDGGYAIISNSISSSPVISYSLKGEFVSIPEAVKNIILKNLEIEKNNETLEINSTRDYLLNNTTKTLKKITKYNTKDLPLNSKWNQDGLYQKHMPKVGNSSTLVGCVNIALGQIMRYHQHPQKGNGIVSNNWNGDYYTAYLNRPYNWDYMPSELNSTSQSHEIDETAMMLYDLGIANQTSFGVSESGTFFDSSVLYKNFGYSKDIKTIGASNKDNFFEVIKSEIDNSRPMYLSIPSVDANSSGHAVVVDDYSIIGNDRYMNVNFGWGGSQDAFINVDFNAAVENLDVSGSGLEITYNIKPCSSENNDCYTGSDLEDGDSISYGIVNPDTKIGSTWLEGHLEDINDNDTYEIHIDGNATFLLSSDYYSSADFFINIYNSENKLVYSTSDNISIALDKDLYKIVVSKNSKSVNTYFPDGETNNFKVEISYKDVDSEIIEEINDNINIAPVFFNNLKFEILSVSEEKHLVINAASNNETTYKITSSNPDVISPTINSNIITIKGLSEGYATLTVKAYSNGKETQLEIPIIVNESKVYLGKDTVITGTFDNTNVQKVFEYQVLTGGLCVFNSTRGYLNTSGFYSSIADSEQTSEISFSYYTYPEISTLSASLSNYYGTYYTAETNKDFSISIDCEDVETSKEYLLSAFNMSDFNETTMYVINENLKEVNTFSLYDDYLDGAATSLSLIGKDMSFFTINNEGILSFINAPDFEDPKDENGDNIYELTVKMLDKNNDNIERHIQVKVQNLSFEITPNDEYSVYQTITNIINPNAEYEDSLDMTIKTQALNGTVLIENGEIKYTPNNGYLGEDSFIVIFTSNNETVEKEFNLVVKSLDEFNNIPTIPLIKSIYSINENTSFIYDFDASDLDDDEITFSISGEDVSLFDIDETTGELSFKSYPDYEFPESKQETNTYKINVNVTDSNNAVSTKAIEIEVLDLIELFTYSSYGVNEDTTVSLDYTVDYSKDYEIIIIEEPSSGIAKIEDKEIIYTPELNYYGEDSLKIKFIHDGIETLKEFKLTVNSNNDAPTLVSSQISFDVKENSIFVTEIKAQDVDNDTLTYSISGEDSSLFGIDEATGEINFLNAPDFENPLDTNKDNFYEVLVTASDNELNVSNLILVEVKDLLEFNSSTLYEINEDTSISLDYTIDFADDYSFKIIEEASNGVVSIEDGKINYSPTSNYYGEDSFELKIYTDDDEIIKKITIEISNVNDAPVFKIEKNSFKIEENIVFIGNFEATDIDSDEITYSISGDDALLFDIDEKTGELNFKTAPDFEKPSDENSDNIYNLTVTAKDKEDTKVEKELEIEINDTFELHVVDAVISDEDNAVLLDFNIQYSKNYTIEIATEPENGIVTIDGDKMTYTPNSNFYGSEKISIIFTYEEGAIEKEVDFHFKNINDSPTLQINQETFEVEENTSYVFKAEATDIENDDITYSISGDDSQYFEINKTTGELNFINAPDFEKPINEDNSYEVTIIASDVNEGSSKKIIIIKVTDIKEDSQEVDEAETETTEFLSLKKGWNLISANIPLDSITSNIQIVWQYDGNTSKWSAYSSIENLKETLKKEEINSIDLITVDQGTWVLANKAHELEITIIEKAISDNKFNKGWNLKGTENNLTVTNLECVDSLLNSAWKYTEGTWKLYTPIVGNYNIESFDTINKNEGFWIDCK